MRVVAITGGTGFVGRHLVRRHVAAGDRVRVLSRRGETIEGAEVVRGDLAAGDIPRAFVENVDVLYHCAGEIKNEGRMHPVHVEGTRALLDVATGNIGSWVQLSSVGVYGRRLDGAVRENDPSHPVGTYERTKADSDALVMGSRVPFTILRPSIIFGNDMPNQSLRQLVSIVERGLFFFIGRPGASANYIHIDNVIDALQLCATPTNDVFNLSDHLTLEAFIGTIADALGKKRPSLRFPATPLRLAARIPKLPLTNARIDALTSRATYPSAKIEEVLGYRHRVPLAEGLRDFVEHGR